MKTLETTSTHETKKLRKEVKKASSLIGFGSFLYTIVMVIVSVAGAFFLVPTLCNPYTNNSLAEWMSNLMNHPAIGILYIASSLIALLVVFICFAKQGTHKQLFQKKQSMTLEKLGGLLCIMYLFGSIGTACYQLIEQDLNLFGLSTSLGLEMACGKSSTIPMFLYASFIGPIVEELVFRGFLMRRMEKHGKLLAVVTSSLLFGLMHENLPQVLNATMVGLVLGYVAMEYSLIWSIVLHIFNNFIMCDLMTRALEDCSMLVQYLIEHSFLWATGIIAIVILIRNRQSIFSWIRNNLCEKKIVVWTLTSVGMVIAVIYHIVNTVQLTSLG